MKLILVIVAIIVVLWKYTPDYNTIYEEKNKQKETPPTEEPIKPTYTIQPTSEHM